MTISDDFFTLEELAAELDVCPRTLRRWHTQRCGPPRVRVGRTILYRKAAVAEWLEANEQAEPRGVAA